MAIRIPEYHEGILMLPMPGTQNADNLSNRGVFPVIPAQAGIQSCQPTISGFPLSRE
jgi:hypothetical protein